MSVKMKSFEKESSEINISWSDSSSEDENIKKQKRRVKTSICFDEIVKNKKCIDTKMRYFPKTQKYIHRNSVCSFKGDKKNIKGFTCKNQNKICKKNVESIINGLNSYSKNIPINKLHEVSNHKTSDRKRLYNVPSTLNNKHEFESNDSNIFSAFNNHTTNKLNDNKHSPVLNKRKKINRNERYCDINKSPILNKLKTRYSSVHSPKVGKIVKNKEVIQNVEQITTFHITETFPEADIQSILSQSLNCKSDLFSSSIPDKNLLLSYEKKQTEATDYSEKIIQFKSNSFNIDTTSDSVISQNDSIQDLFTQKSSIANSQESDFIINTVHSCSKSNKLSQLSLLINSTPENSVDTSRKYESDMHILNISNYKKEEESPSPVKQTVLNNIFTMQTNYSSLHVNMDTKKIARNKKSKRIKKNTLAYRLQKLLQIQKSDVAFWKHEFYLESKKDYKLLSLYNKNLILNLIVRQWWIEYNQILCQCLKNPNNLIIEENARNSCPLYIVVINSNSIESKEILINYNLVIYPIYNVKEVIINKVMYTVILNADKIHVIKS